MAGDLEGGKELKRVSFKTLKLKYLENLEEFVVHEFKTKQRLSNKGLKRNLCLVCHSTTELELARKDAKRCWRTEQR